MRGAALLLFYSLPLAAQQARIEGVATDAVSHEPLANVHVRLFIARTGAPAVAYGAMSDRTGRFAISSVAPGTYSVMAEHTGFAYLGARTVALKTAQSLTDFKLEMTPEALISGRVLDENGDPLQGASVGISQVDGESIVPPEASNTDENGAFRARGAPGKYYVEASPPPNRLESDAGREIRANGAAPGVHVATWFPDTTSKDRAAIVEAVAGHETGGIDIRLARQTPLRISGVVKGIPEGTTQTMIVAEGEPGLSQQGPGMTTAGPDGKFTFAGLLSGTYRIMVLDAGGLVSRRVKVELNDADVTDVELTLQGPEKLGGILEMPGDRAKSIVALDQAGEPEFPTRQPEGGEVDKNGAFIISGLFPGRYRVEVSPLPGNSYVREVRLDGALVKDVLDLSSGVRGSSLKVVVSADGGELSGAVQSSDGGRLTNTEASVYLTADPNQIRAEEMTELAPDGTYSFHGIRPGKYRIFAIRESQDGGFRELQSIAAKAQELEIKPGASLKKDLRLEESHAK
jgi:protocatechuate 3,4-dioxygenase beta subunit